MGGLTTHPFNGTETLGIEIFGSLSHDRARDLADVPFAWAEAADGRVCASVLVILIERLAVDAVPILRFTYPEALWLLHLEGASRSRVAVRAHTTLRMLPALTLVDRYAATRADIAIAPRTVSVRTATGTLDARVSSVGEADGDHAIERLITRAKGGRLYDIPWGAHEPRRTERLEPEIVDRSLVDAIFGHDFRFDGRGLAYHDRHHACSPATPLSARNPR